MFFFFKHQKAGEKRADTIKSENKFISFQSIPNVEQTGRVDETRDLDIRLINSCAFRFTSVIK